MINSWNVFGRSVFNAGHTVIASMAFEFFLDKYGIADGDESSANFLEGYHNCLIALKNIPKAIKVGEEIIVMYKRMINAQEMTVLIPNLLNLLFNQMSVFHSAQKTEEMMAMGVKGLKLIKENELQVSPASAGIYNNFTVGYISIGDYNSAFDAAKLALTHYEKLAQVDSSFMTEYLDFKKRFMVFDGFPESLIGTSKLKQIINNL